MTLPNQSMAVNQVNLSDFLKADNGRNLEIALLMTKILKNHIGSVTNFTGKVVFTVNCRNGGIGNVEAFIQKKID